MSLEFDDARFLLLVAALAPFLLAWQSRSLAQLSRGRAAFSTGLRILLVTCLAGALSGAAVRDSNQDACITVAVDVSDSMDESSILEGVALFRDLARRAASRDRVQLVAFAERATEVEPTGDLSPDALRSRVGRGGSNLMRGIQLSRSLSSGQCAGRVVLVSDGRETRGQVVQSWPLLSGGASPREALDMAFFWLRSEPIARADVAVSGLIVPPEVRVGEPFRFQVHLASSGARRVQLRVSRGLSSEKVIEREVEVSPEGTTVSFESALEREGPSTLWAEVAPDKGDAFPENNRIERRVVALGPPSVLIVDRDPSTMDDVRHALVTQKFAVHLTSPGDVPRSQAELGAFAAIVLSDLKNAELDRGAQERIVRYVRQGGALLFSGGERSYGAGNFEGSLLESILPLKIVGEDERERASVAMALVIDRSGSMSGEPLEMAKRACFATLSILEPSDLFEVVAFDAKPIRAVRMQRARQGARIAAELSRVDSGGGTEIFPALDMAYKDLLAADARKKHIILLTDGNADSEGLSELASAALADGITLTAVGFGATINEQLLRALADLGGGRFHAARDASLLPRIFTRETELMTQEDQTSELLSIQVRTPASFLKGIAMQSAPPLRGIAKLRFEGPPAELILAVDRGYPLLAAKRVGLGSSLAWASDLKSNYAKHLLGWRQLPQFLSQLIRGHGKRDDTARWPLDVEVLGEELVVSYDALSETGDFMSQVVSKLWARPDDGGSTPELELPFRLVAPGRYEARLARPKGSATLLRAEHFAPTGDLLARSFQHFTLPYPEEYASQISRPVRGLEAYRLSAPESAQKVVDAPRQTTRRTRLATWLLALAALLLLVDIAVRRLRFASGEARLVGPG